MATQLEKAIVRIFCRDRSEVCGGGFLIAPQYILTCAHVVTGVLGIELESNTPKPEEVLEIDFPMLAPHTFLSTRVHYWSQTNGIDMAVLELLSPIPVQGHPIPLKLLQDFSDRPYRAFGFSQDNGRWSNGKMRGALANGHIQLDNDPASQQYIEAGFSGTAIWDEKARGAVGMVVSRDNTERYGSFIPSAFMIPVKKLCETWPPLKEFLLLPPALILPSPAQPPPELQRAEEHWDLYITKEIEGHKYFLTERIQEDEHSVPGLVQRLYKARQTALQPKHDVWIKHHALRHPEITPRQALLPIRKEGELLQKLRRLSSAWPRLEGCEYLPESIILIYTALPWKSLAETFGLSGKPLDSQRADLLLQAMPTLCTQLAQLHTQKYAHRMLTPENILMNNQRPSQAVLKDVGLATQPFRPGEGPTGYMAPEQSHQGYHRPGTDIYQVGAILYHLLVGEKPSNFFYGIEPPSQRNPALPVALDAVLLRALQEDVKERWTNMSEFSAALKQCTKEFLRP